MRKRYTTAIFALTMAAALMAGCNTTSNVAESTETQAESTIYGTITEVDDDSITIEIQEKEEAEDSDSEGSSSEDESSESTDSETQTISITDDTTVSQAMGGGPGGEAPSGEAPSGEAPSGEAPSGDAESGEASTGTPPEKPEGDDQNNDSDTNTDNNANSDSADNQPQGNPPEAQELTVSDLKEGDTVEITLDSDGNAESIAVQGAGGPGGAAGGGQSQQPESYDSANEITSDLTVSSQVITSTETDENAILVSNGATATISDTTVSRESSDSTGGDTSSFYGVGSAILTTDGTTYISNSTIETDAQGGAGVFAYDKGTVYVSDTTITTTQDTSGGIHVAGGGTLYAWDVTATTNGESSAAIRSDRGGGTMVVDGGTYTSNGTGSPAVYSTADITINDATLTATNSEAVCIEGLNTLRLYNSDLTGNMPDNDQNDCTWNVILYQSMSGDSEIGNSTFTMQDGTITANNGGMFYTTNTESTFVLENVDITYADENEFFLRATGNNNSRGWGTAGENGAQCSFTGINQAMEGDVIWDSISELDFYMTEGSTLTGAVVQDNTYANDGTGGYANIYIDSSSTWIVTGDSTVTSLDNAGTIQDSDGNTVTIKGTDGTVYVEGSSEYTITVESYSTDGDVSGAGSIDSYDDYKVEKVTNAN